jgi:hypothetical protein
MIRFIIAYLVLSLLLPFTALGQANFALANRYGVDAPVFDAQGIPLAGTNYLAELWGAATPDALKPLVIVDRNGERETVPFGNPGYFFSPSGSLGVPTVSPFGWAWLQVRAWDTRLGATYEEVAPRGLGGYGESPLFYAQGSGLCGGVPCLPAPLIIDRPKIFHSATGHSSPLSRHYSPERSSRAGMGSRLQALSTPANVRY